jgi:nucleoside-diphosphate-sugar epimerase
VIAIVGAGWLGASLARSLPPPVVATTRSGQWREQAPERARPDGVQVVALDVCAAKLDVTPLQHATALVLCYAPGRTQDRRALYVEGTRRLLETRMAAGEALRRVVYVGSTSALPDVDGWVDESCEIWPDHERGRIQRDAEAVVSSLCETNGVPWLVLRMGGLHGPGRELDRIYSAQSSGGGSRRTDREGRLPGHGMQPTNLVHLDDAVAAVRAALHAPPEITGCIHVVDDDHTPRREMYARIARARGLEPLRWSQAPPDDGGVHGKRVRNDKLRSVLGVRLLHPSHS